MLLGVVEFPCPHRAGHDVQIIEIVAAAGVARVIAARHHDHVAILDGHRLVERAVIGIDALKGKALRRVDAVVVGLLELRFRRQIVRVVLVRGDRRRCGRPA